MATNRLIGLRTIRATKIERSRSWFMTELRATRAGLRKENPFPEPKIPSPGGAESLWDEGDIDRWVEGYLARSSAPASRTPRAPQAIAA